jgi:U3 small nucleolar RNA-associated protein 4
MMVTFTPCLPAMGSATARANSVNPLATSASSVFEDSYHRRMALPSMGAVKLAKSSRLVLCRKDNSISVWSLFTRCAGGGASGHNVPTFGWEQLLEMEFKLKTHLISAAISDDAQWLAVSDAEETKLFQLAKVVGFLGCIVAEITLITPLIAQCNKTSPLSNQNAENGNVSRLRTA